MKLHAVKREGKSKKSFVGNSNIGAHNSKIEAWWVILNSPELFASKQIKVSELCYEFWKGKAILFTFWSTRPTHSHNL